jgi:hypothetical protein
MHCQIYFSPLLSLLNDLEKFGGHSCYFSNFFCLNKKTIAMRNEVKKGSQNKVQGQRRSPAIRSAPSFARGFKRRVWSIKQEVKYVLAAKKTTLREL